MGPYFFCALAEWIARLNCIQRYFILRMTAIRKAVWDGELPLLAGQRPPCFERIAKQRFLEAPAT
jgi:hypothetical protein